MKIEKKAWPETFQKILDGKKNFDLRLADFEAKEGDVFVLKEFNPETKQYTGREIEKKINFVLKSKEQKFWKKEDVEKFGFQVIGF
jgi:ribosomal protein S17